jgi:tetratricopeptide (TPR) repeat protein
MKPRLLNCLLCVAVFVALPLSCAGVPSSAIPAGTAAGIDNVTAPLIVPQTVTSADNQTGGGAITALLRADDYDRVIGEANAALGNNPGDLNLREKLADAYIARAWYYKVKRLNTYTLNDLFKAVEIAPQYYRAHYELGRFHNNQWQFSIGLFDLNKALSLKPDFAPAYSERGYSNYKNRKYEAALADVNKAIELDAADGQFYYMRSLVYRGMGESDLAVSDLETTIRLSKDQSLTDKAAADLLLLQPK